MVINEKFVQYEVLYQERFREHMKEPIKKELFAEAWAKGVKVKEMIKVLGVSRRTLCYWRKTMGLPGRRRAS